jgi:hypothetical protein
MLKVIVGSVVAALAVGGVGFATAGNDHGPGDQAWAQVNPNGGSPKLMKAKNVESVSSPATGIYCLHMRPGVDLVNTAPVAVQEQNLSGELGFVTARALNGTENVYCPVKDLQVNTWKASNPESFELVNDVAFDVIVP